MKTPETILFTKALNLEFPWKITSVEFEEEKGEMNIFIDFEKGSTFACPKCSKMVNAYDTTIKRWRHLNFFQYACYLTARVPRVDCPKDGALQIEVPWARNNTDLTLLFESLMMTLCREMPVNKVAKIIGANGNKLWRVMDYYTLAARKLEDFSGVTKIGVDETSKTKGHKYVTLFVDLEERRTIFVAKGKGAKTIGQFKKYFAEHGGKCEIVTDFSIDMSPAFIKGVEENFPNAKITFDKFHVIKIIGSGVDEVRREEVKDQEILRGKRYIFLKNKENLTKKQEELLEEVKSISQLNLKTLKAYHIRENFQEIYKSISGEEFKEKLKEWYFWATHSRLKPIINAAKTIKRHWDGIIQWYESKINNGILEGLNSLVQAAKAKARGYKTFKNLSIMIYLITGKLDFSKVGLPT